MQDNFVTPIPETQHTMEYLDRNHNRLAPRLYKALKQYGIPMTSRNGPVLRLPGVVTLTVTNPRERVNFCPARDANPFFHLMEAMAMLAAFNNAPFLAYFAKNMLSFADDGKRYNAFYGERLRTTWGDQLSMIITELTRDPWSRQAVAQIWDPADLSRSTKDKACNLCLLFSVNPRSGALDMTSINRSNDSIWGILSGANVVHLSIFQEYVACGLNREVGEWSHVTNNLHVYTENPQWQKVLAAAEQDGPACEYSYVYSRVMTSRLLYLQHDAILNLHGKENFDADNSAAVGIMAKVALEDAPISHVHHLMDSMGMRTPFVSKVVLPMFCAWHARKNGDDQSACDWADSILANDWRLACRNWLSRHER